MPEYGVIRWAASPINVIDMRPAVIDRELVQQTVVDGAFIAVVD